MIPKLSVILPCYHVESFLPDILSDLRAQSFQEMEIILVNDGGEESQLQLMYQLKASDDKIIIVNKENGGLSSARNVGLSIAKGEYIVFVDPDDRLKPFYLQKLYDAITVENADIAAGGYVFNYERENRTVNDFLDCSELPIDGNKRIEILLSVPTVRNAVWNKIYRSEFLKNNQLYFNEELFYGEDEVFNMQCFLQTNHVTLISECGYIYMCRDSNSICSKYIKQHREARELALSLRIQVMEKIGMENEHIQQILMTDYNLLGYFLLCNLFKKDSPLSFKEKKAYIQSHIWGNPHINEAFKTWDRQQDNFFTNVYYRCFKWHNATIITCVFNILYELKYNFMTTYVTLSPYLKNYRKKIKIC